MSLQLVLVLLPILLVLVVLGVVLAIRPRVTRTLYAGTGVDEWREVLAGLSWRERWTLYWANMWGRATRPELAALAVQRGEVVIASAEALSRRTSRLRVVWLVLGGSSLLLCLWGIGRLIAGEREPHDWLQVVTQGGLAAMWLGMPALHRRDARSAQLSIERNRELLEARADRDQSAT